LTNTSVPSVEQVPRALSAVGDLIEGVRAEQRSAPTPCTDWTVRQLVKHLVGMNLVFAALLSNQGPPERVAERLVQDPIGAYRGSGSALQAGFDQPGVLERSYQSHLGAATGSDRLQVRLYDLLVHGRDLAQATGQPAALPDDLAEQSLASARAQLSTQPRTGRFGPVQTVADGASAIDRLAAFLGRRVSTL
jgi:uncharacterized protein (TIGR03086 family)